MRGAADAREGRPEHRQDVTYSGAAELTFADNEHLMVEAERVLIAMSDRNVGALRISPGEKPNLVEFVEAMEAGPFTLSFHGGIVSCRVLNFACRAPDADTWEMVVVFEAA